MSLFSKVAKKVTDVATFIEEHASASTLKYMAGNDVTHRLYFPVHIDETGKPIPYVFEAPIHTWGSNKNNYGSCMCTKGIDDGDKFDGSCPVCDRLEDASAIVDYLKAEVDAACTLTGDDRTKYLDEQGKKIWGDRKVSAARSKYYVALAMLNCGKDGRTLADDDKPKFTIKIAAWTENSMMKILTALTERDEEPNIGGLEFKLKYGSQPELASRVGQVAVTWVDKEKMLVKPGTPLAAEIAAALENFDFEHSIQLCRRETAEKTPAELQRQMDKLFQAWDTYKAELAVNPNAKYLECAGTAVITEKAAPPSGAPAGALISGPQAGTLGGEVRSGINP